MQLIQINIIIIISLVLYPICKNDGQVCWILQEDLALVFFSDNLIRYSHLMNQDLKIYPP